MAKTKKIPAAKIFTIGFAKKSAETFFETLTLHQITELVDVRLHNNSQVFGYTKSPDLKFFLQRICSIEYRHDLKFTPSEEALQLYRQRLISWEDYVEDFARLMRERRVVPHILRSYSDSPEVRYCLLCAEASPINCHRRLVAEKFAEVFEGMEIAHL